MSNNISKNQHLAIEMVQKLSDQVTQNPEIRDIFCTQIRTKILGETGESIETYSKILASTLDNHAKIDHLCNYTLRNATRNILKILTNEGHFTQEERKQITQKATQGGGSRGALATQIVQNMNPLNTNEKAILENIRTSGLAKYKRGTTRNIEAIQKDFEKEIGHTNHSKYKIKHYLNQFNNEKKKTISREDYPEEIATLKDLFQYYFKPDKKLPTKLIMEELNNKHKHNRSENSIEGYIRTHIKTNEQKAKLEPIRSEEEKKPLEIFRGKKENYRNKTGKQIGKINWGLAYQTYKSLYPESKRTARALEHKLKELRKEE